MRLLITFSGLFISIFLFGQQERSWQEKMGDPNVSFYEIQADFNAYWENREIPKGAGHMPYKRWEYFMETRVDSNGFYDPQKRVQAYEKYIENRIDRKNTNPWSVLGPSQMPTGNNGIGRINVIAVHPEDPDTIFIGAPAGGLWYTYDDGVTWTTPTDDLPTLGVSDIVFDPSNSDIMYMATGDRDHNDAPTVGILKSSDGGLTWVSTDFEPGQNGLPGFYIIHQLLMHPSNGNIMIATTTAGVFRTTDAWSTWTEVLPNDCIRHAAFKPGDPNVVYGTTSTAYCGGLNGEADFFRSANNGVTWSEITLPNSAGLDRIGIGVTEDDPTIVWLLAAENDPSGSNDFEALYKSTNSGLSFSEITPSHAPALGSQQWYDWSFAVDENDADILYAGGVHIEKSTNGGSTFSRVSNNGSNNVHVDHHFAKFMDGYLYVGSDGGIWRTNNGASSWDVLNGNLEITQYYRISNAETNMNRMLAGSQDNGTHMLNSGTWSHEFGGDGMDNAIDPNDATNLFCSYQYGNFFRSTNTGGSWSSMIDGNDTGTSGAWVTPIKIDETNTNTIYTGYDRIWKSTNDGVSWNDVAGQKLTPGNNKLQYIEVAKSNSSYIYTTDYSNIWRSTNGGSSWSLLTDPGNSIRWIEVDPADEDHVWITSANKVYESTNGGNSWTDITSGLPNISMNTLVYDEGDPDEAIYVGTDVGVFYQDNNSGGWQPMGTGLPNTVVLELDILESQSLLRAGTFGRGVWEVDLIPGGCSISAINDLGIDSCDPPNNQYGRSLEIVYNNAPATGSLSVLGQTFPITSSPQTVVVTLPTNGVAVTVTANFTAEPSCSFTANALFVNPTIETWFEDQDGDGFGDPNTPVDACERPPGYVENNLDCDDNDPNNFPGNTEVCDGQDNNCDGNVDEGLTSTYYLDDDSDGFGDANMPLVTCNPPSNYVTDNTDCDDSDPNNYPGNTEVCDGQDNNCDGNVDEGLTSTYYLDFDNDGFGDANMPLVTCNPPSNYVTDNTDCDDDDPNNYPGNTEVCDGQDNNCDGNVDEGLSSTFYLDNDNDGFGDASMPLVTCNPPSNYVSDNTDCDDNDATNYPGNTEICDGKDNNCDGNVDEGLLSTYYLDSDSDGFGDNAMPLITCNPPSNYVTNNTDCDDNDPTSYPGNSEICGDGNDNNCDGQVDEGCGPPPDCDDVYLVINAISQDSNHAQINLESDALVNNGQSVLFTAGTDIDLVSPFEVVQGTIFEAKIEPCILQGPLQNDNQETLPGTILERVFENIENGIDLEKVTNLKLLNLSDQILFENHDLEVFKTWINQNEQKLNGFYTIVVTEGTRSIEQKLAIIPKR